MVVCKCRKATKLYCFVHKLPVCGECICFPEHQICVVRTYSEWVIDGDYDWPPACCLCQAMLEDGSDSHTTRLGCLHVIHTSCLVSHIKSYPQNTAPAGFVCPACSTSIWPPKSIKDSGSSLHSKLKETIMQVSYEANCFFLAIRLILYPIHANSQIDRRDWRKTCLEVIPFHCQQQSTMVPPAFASDPLVHLSANGGREKSSSDPSTATGIGPREISVTDIVEIDGPNARGNQIMSDNGPNFIKNTSPAGPGATTRKGAYHVERQNSEISYYADDEDGNQKKYTRRGHAWQQWVYCITDWHKEALVKTSPMTNNGSRLEALV
ncbi:hypothetical protein IFM89_016710 [Coptis chinensis]|uniref:RING-type domain-containing protein n=1 Tax=Coptis chinensis TaxID=261450 RepID=A0A835IP30_9MAGN|nr:hypothetical protein IFM89_016710 [Coptis chinensis]